MKTPNPESYVPRSEYLELAAELEKVRAELGAACDVRLAVHRTIPHKYFDQASKLPGCGSELASLEKGIEILVRDLESVSARYERLDALARRSVQADTDLRNLLGIRSY